MLHADGAGAYPKVLIEALSRTNTDGTQATPRLWLDQVDHSGAQFTRFHRHVVCGMEFPYSRIRVTAGTQMVDGWWNLLKHHCLPEQTRVIVEHVSRGLGLELLHVSGTFVLPYANGHARGGNSNSICDLHV